MKPGKPLQRKTPFRSRTELPRTPFPSRCEPLRRTPLARESSKRRRDNGQRRVVVSALHALSDGRCPRCGQAGLVLHGHERRRRSQDSRAMLRPDVLICDPCNSAVAASPRVSAWNGWHLTAKHPHDPALTSTQARSLTGEIVEFAVDDDEFGGVA